MYYTGLMHMVESISKERCNSGIKKVAHELGNEGASCGLVERHQKSNVGAESRGELFRARYRERFERKETTQSKINDVLWLNFMTIVTHID